MFFIPLTSHEYMPPKTSEVCFTVRTRSQTVLPNAANPNIERTDDSQVCGVKGNKAWKISVNTWGSTLQRGNEPALLTIQYGKNKISPQIDTILAFEVTTRDGTANLRPLDMRKSTKDALKSKLQAFVQSK